MKSHTALNKALSQFNSPDTVIAITSFPTQASRIDTKGNFSAIGSHIEKIADELAKHRPVLVLAETAQSAPEFAIIKQRNVLQQDPQAPENSMIRHNIGVQRVWTKGNIATFFNILRAISNLPRVKSIYIPFEFNVYGGIVPNIVLLGLLSVFKLMGKNITFELHQVILDIHKVKKHVNLRNPIQIAIYNVGLKLYYVGIGIVSSSIVVFEMELKNRLKKYTSEAKVTVLSLPVDVIEKKKKVYTNQKVFKKYNVSRNSQPRSLLKTKNTLNVLVFGFINGYKGIPWIIRLFDQEKTENMHLTIAGGKNPYLKHLPFYKKFYATVQNAAYNRPNITHTGFVPDRDIAAHFSNADVVVMPYTAFMSASGPFSLALSYQKPILMSDTLSPYLESKDMKIALKNASLKPSDIFFSMHDDDLMKKLRLFKKNAAYRNNLTAFSQELADSRSIENVVDRLNKIIAAGAASSPAQIRVKLAPSKTIAA